MGTFYGWMTKERFHFKKKKDKACAKIAREHLLEPPSKDLPKDGQ